MGSVWAQAKVALIAVLAAALGFLGGELWRGQQPAPVVTPPPINLPAPSPSSWSVAANSEGAWAVSRDGQVFFCDRTQCTQIRN